MDRQEGR
ncbi:hypothetical protein BIW11_04859 [Tropilaelaps mercedesae]|nr:hypothetical protein BIW11_13752 [Tropilaelaps mercedesae]OQR67056.1 hypothetical protein BIW11_04859 [Tropilaelaps mercedesae]